MSLTPPPKGSMYLFDYITPPLRPDSYRLHVSTDLAFASESHSLDDDRYFDVAGPRFNLSPTEIAGVFPPRNGHGPFADVLAQVAIQRRTLPWERPIDSTAPIGEPTGGLGPGYPTPWLALLLFEEGEYTLLQGVPLDSVVPKAVFQRLGSPQNILCDAVEADLSLVQTIMPSKEELQLLSHVRWVNKDDRELSVEGSDGWFAIVMTNRVPTPGAKCRACLVSVEERVDLVPKEPPPTYVPTDLPLLIDFEVRDVGPQAIPPAKVFEQRVPLGRGRLVGVLPAKSRLVLLHSWQFVCEGAGTFFNLMQNLDAGMIGKTNADGQPVLTDTAHLQLDLYDRAGTGETALYRGPLVPFQLTRDPLGPYHSADQARRATPEAGVEDVSYAAAFEVGRLLAAADARLAQELIRWRRESYQQAARQDTLITISKISPDLAALPVDVSTRVLPYLAALGTAAMVKGAGPIADAYGIQVALKANDPQVLMAAWGLASVLEAQQVLGSDPGTLGVPAPALVQTDRPDVTLDVVSKDTASIQRLSAARDQVLVNAKIQAGG